MGVSSLLSPVGPEDRTQVVRFGSQLLLLTKPSCWSLKWGTSLQVGFTDSAGLASQGDPELLLSVFPVMRLLLCASDPALYIDFGDLSSGAHLVWQLFYRLSLGFQASKSMLLA